MTADNVADLIRERVEQAPDEPFLRFEGSTSTHAQVYDRACRIAHLASGPIAVLADGCPEVVQALWAAALSGRIFVDVSDPEEVVPDDTGLLLVEPKYAPLVPDQTMDLLTASGRLLVIDREAPSGLVEASESLEAAVLVAAHEDPDIVPEPDDALTADRSHREALATVRDDLVSRVVRALLDGTAVDVVRHDPVRRLHGPS